MTISIHRCKEDAEDLCRMFNNDPIGSTNFSAVKVEVVDPEELMRLGGVYG